MANTIGDHIVKEIEEMDGNTKVKHICPDLGYLDIVGKVGKGSLGPLAEEGIIVVAVNGNIAELGAGKTRVWFDYPDE